ncbi:uncharacterized protein EI90DRAFT_3041523 [Cantharellus anzutake]|uniref:uncharacterized protein n=1 Tax=Cantharellus anzutake TaxID=1750568 RepID=UPI001908BED3|nr:uncharacterized protein EI90DRAFT_3041523 [Cantharellus anzutake]KAF8338082.1 hypothetical protein EI90DRAFT_3041523 [Cantharellus anzutake]
MMNDVNGDGVKVGPSSYEPRVRKGRMLVLYFDGSDDRYDSTNSNVVKLFSFLAKGDPNQLVYYQAGIGTYNLGPQFVSGIARWIARIVDLAVAFSLGGHVKGGYRFLQDHYQDGDRICLFGFSRGAYTARALAGMLYTVGLLPPGMAEEVHFAYEIYKNQTASASYKRDFSRQVKIEFIGVWDTVSSVGALIPRILPFSSDNHITRTFRHAMSLDEHRAAFQCNPWQRTVDGQQGGSGPRVGILRTSLSILWKTLAFWNWRKNWRKGDLESGEGPTNPEPPTHVKEVWFAGCHSDVGGGSVANDSKVALSNIPLRWMIKEILEADTGIIFNDDPRLAELGIVLNPPPIVTANIAESTSHVDETTPLRPRMDVHTTTQYTAPDSTLEFVLENKDNLTATREALPRDTDARLELEDLPSRHLPDDIHEEDVVTSMHDELKADPLWWILEFLPFLRSKQKADGEWVSYPRINLFRGREIPPPPAEDSPNSSSQPGDHRGVHIPPCTLFHVSVQARMNAPAEVCGQRSWRTLWLKKEPYAPRARLHGPMKFVR